MQTQTVDEVTDLGIASTTSSDLNHNFFNTVVVIFFFADNFYLDPLNVLFMHQIILKMVGLNTLIQMIE